MKKVVVAGHICLDITPVFSSDKIQQVEEVLIPGKMIEMKDVDVHTGGVVANTGLGMKILGADVTLMGKVGNDAFGELVLNILSKYNAAEGMIVSESVDTSYSVVLAMPGIDRIFLHNPGANDTFTREDLDFSLIEKASLFHFGYPPIMKNMYENEGAELVSIFKRVKELGVATSLDMATPDAESRSGKVDWNTIIKNVLPYVDFFVPSIEELGFMINRTGFNEWSLRAKGKDITSVLSVKEDIKPLADRLIAWGAKVILIKCGAPGIYIRTANKEELSKIGLFTENQQEELTSQFTCHELEQWADLEWFEESYEPSKVLSGTGAGDTSIAAFLTAMLKGFSPQKCLQLATATGASCVEAYDALSGLRSFDELNKKIESGWKKQHLIDI